MLLHSLMILLCFILQSIELTTLPNRTQELLLLQDLLFVAIVRETLLLL